MKIKFLFVVLIALFSNISAEAKTFDADTFKTAHGEVAITFIKHGTLMLTFNGKTIHIDPVSMYADYSVFPKADYILITHEHGDHLDAKAVEKLTKESTILIINQSGQNKLGKGEVMKNGDIRKVNEWLKVEAVPAYNTTAGREMYHPRHRDNGYVLTLDGLRIYVAGDTEDIPEMKNLKKIDVAFLPVNQPYTMTVEQAESASRTILPKVLYPYHYGETEIGKLKDSLNDTFIDFRIRDLR